MSYYKEQIPEIIENLKVAVQQCLDIIKQPIDSTLADDKLHAALKGKRMATEDVKFYAKEVDSLQNEALGIEPESEGIVNKSRRHIREQ